MKMCSTCKQSLPDTDFNLKNAAKGKRSSTCSECHKVYRKEHYRKNRQKYIDKARYWESNNIARHNLKTHEGGIRSRFGLSLVEYTSMLVAQDGRCAICKEKSKDKRLAVDHCHKTGKIRGLLCSRCNRALGAFRDSAEILRAAADYVAVAIG